MGTVAEEPEVSPVRKERKNAVLLMPEVRLLTFHVFACIRRVAVRIPIAVGSVIF